MSIASKPKVSIRNRLEAAYLALVHGKVNVVEIKPVIHLPPGARCDPESLTRLCDDVAEHIEFALQEAKQ